MFNLELDIRFLVLYLRQGKIFFKGIFSKIVNEANHFSFVILVLLAAYY